MTLEQAEKAYKEAQHACDVAAGAWVAAATKKGGDAKERARMYVAFMDMNRTGIDYAWEKAMANVMGDAK